MVNWVSKLKILIFLLCIPQRIFAEYYNVEIDSTGVSHLIILQDSTSLEPGFEVGIFDLNAILNSNNCDNEFGELLVGYGVIPEEPEEECGNTLCISAIGSIDLCDIGGEQIPGFVEDSPIVVRVWDPYAGIEYSTTFTTNQSICSSSTFSGLCTSITELTLETELGIPLLNKEEDSAGISFSPNPAINFTLLSVNAESLSSEPIIIYDIMGKMVKTFDFGFHRNGQESFHWNTASVTPGIYFAGFKNSSPDQFSKLIILK